MVALKQPQQLWKKDFRKGKSVPLENISGVNKHQFGVSKLLYNQFYIVVYRRATKFVKSVSFFEKSPCSKRERVFFCRTFKESLSLRTPANLLKIIHHSKFVHTLELLHRNIVKAIEKLV